MKEHIRHINASAVTEDLLEKLSALSEVAKKRGQTISQMALSWVLRHPEMTSTVIGVSKVEQLRENLGALLNMTFTESELLAIDAILLRKQG